VLTLDQETRRNREGGHGKAYGRIRLNPQWAPNRLPSVKALERVVGAQTGIALEVRRGRENRGGRGWGGRAKHLKTLAQSGNGKRSREVVGGGSMKQQQRGREERNKPKPQPFSGRPT